MLRYIIVRLAYSIVIVLGVMLLTFALFNLAAGDPAAVLLGKNATPEEIESLRRELGSDLPILWGRYRKTESFSSAKFDRELDWSKRRIAVQNGAVENRALALYNGQVSFKRNFVLANQTLAVELEFSGELENDSGTKHHADGFEKLRLMLPANAETVCFKGNAMVRNVQFVWRQAHLFNSQFTHALTELVSFKSEFPYVSFFNFGRSITTREPISEIFSRGLGPSLCLMVPIFLGELLFGILIALLSTAYKDTLIDKTLVAGAVAGMSLSYLVVIIFAQWYLGYYCNLFPVWGWGAAKFLYLPVLVGVICGVGSSVRFYRTVFVNELNKEYLRTAAAKGGSPARVYLRHLLRNALIPIISQISTTLPFLFTGSLLAETFFGIPGLGFASIDALNNSDLQQLKALVIVSAGLFVVINFIADLAYAAVDPRLRIK